jgi:P27 family predicted phage terminase small subunit
MAAGRPRKPDELKILEGTFRKDRDGDPSQAVQATGEPAPPPHLKGEALAFWSEVVPGLVATGVAKAADAPALAGMCEWWARYRKLARRLDRMTGKAAKAMPQVVMMLGIAWDKFDRVAARFGLTPSDRAKLRLGDQQKTAGVMSRRRDQRK